MTLNGRNVTLAEIKRNYGVHQKNLNEDRFILSAAKCRPMILVFRNIKYVRIFAEVALGGASILSKDNNGHACAAAPGTFNMSKFYFR